VKPKPYDWSHGRRSLVNKESSYGTEDMDTGMDGTKEKNYLFGIEPVNLLILTHELLLCQGYQDNQ